MSIIIFRKNKFYCGVRIVLSPWMFFFCEHITLSVETQHCINTHLLIFDNAFWQTNITMDNNNSNKKQKLQQRLVETNMEEGIDSSTGIFGNM